MNTYLQKNPRLHRLAEFAAKVDDATTVMGSAYGEDIQYLMRLINKLSRENRSMRETLRKQRQAYDDKSRQAARATGVLDSLYCYGNEQTRQRIREDMGW